MLKERKLTPLEETRAAVVLAHIRENPIGLNGSWYRDWERCGLSRAALDAALNLLAARGQIKFEVGMSMVLAVRVKGAQE